MTEQEEPSWAIRILRRRRTRLNRSWTKIAART